MLQSLDTHWREHLAALDHLRQGIHLRGYAQKNPKQEYKREAFELFENLLNKAVRNDVTRLFVTVQIRSAEDVEETAPRRRRAERAVPPRRLRRGTGRPRCLPAQRHSNLGPGARKVGRNDACPCGSGKVQSTATAS